jgi:hypothetical protein
MAYPGANKIAESPMSAEIGADKVTSRPRLMAADWCGLEWMPWVPVTRVVDRGLKTDSYKLTLL